MRPGTFSRCAWAAWSILLVPVLLLALWLEVVAGVSFSWSALVGYVSPAQPHLGAGLLFLTGAAAGPVLVIFATFRTRHREVSAFERILTIECWSLPVALPLAILGLLLLLAASAGI